MKIGTPELVVILIVALLVLGPDKLPYYARKVGKAMSQLKGYTNELAKEINDNVVEPIEEVKKPLKKVTDPLSDISSTITNPVKDVENSIKNIGKIDKNDAAVQIEKDKESRQADAEDLLDESKGDS